MVHVTIVHDVDVFVARGVAREVAGRAGFSRPASEEMALVVTELATNILKHATTGALSVQHVRCRMRGPGLSVLAEDRGPPIHDFALAQLDGHDDRGPVDLAVRRRGIAAGLGTVGRLCDLLSHRVEDGGNVIRATKYLVRRSR